VVEDQNHGARLTYYRLVAFRRAARVANDFELLAQVGIVQRLLRQSWKRRPWKILDHLRRRESEHRLAQRAGVERKLQADLKHAEGRVRAEHVVDDHDARPVHDADANRSAGPGREVIRMADGARPQLVAVEV